MIVDNEDPVEPVEADEPVDIAHDLLARTRGETPASRDGVRRRAAGARRRQAGAARGRDREQWSGAGPDALDPVRVGAVFAGFVAERGWDSAMAEARVLSDWATLVGADIAAHCHPVGLAGGELRLAAETTAWATQLRLLAPVMVTRIAEQVGHGVVRHVHVTGPVTPSWRHGLRAVRGARGPRDTYG